MKNIILYLTLFFSVVTFSQKKDFDLPQANENYIKKEYALAESNYRISKANNKKRATASYNLGNAIYKQNQPTEAKYAYSKAIENAKGKQQKFSAFHNIGNVFMKEKDYSKAVDAYKNALRNNPKDEQTRYNYALAKKMLKENPPKKDDKKKDDKKDKKDEPKDDKKDKPKDGDDKKDDKGKPKDDKQNEQPKPQQGGANQERMKNLLDAVNNEEKKTQEKVKGKKAKGKPVETDKDW
ncbi:tetratricopeptide repeat protein [Flavobacterium psychrophilum]|uniref:tetratricopeptide repeat protein n=1 Tax=Flavobacterium psychrophilum TaxID=96345 RepID=UPI000B8E9128|nr:tetratricopeptide repeat protein [Flavobacterium psychrophilum]EKT4501134.1 tetratricopeptide repeat protein [Flavobacterium psychrophilum]ELY2010054.1 tetratricopeptide repeat protein [Flavobacterium psychrophilum]QRE61719.1 tetratricopeptide repeat protein [Flavobacterium psychrophilum]QRE63908.1 tetratricopeptide repeat protein [Flavobacterium psychrophilum]